MFAKTLENLEHSTWCTVMHITPAVNTEGQKFVGQCHQTACYSSLVLQYCLKYVLITSDLYTAYRRVPLKLQVMLQLYGVTHFTSMQVCRSNENKIAFKPIWQVQYKPE
jgi:hypothetical protein